jgi:hypothetical protein
MVCGLWGGIQCNTPCSGLFTGGTTVLGTAPSGAAATASQLSQNRSYEDVLQAMNERNCRAISQHSDTPVTLLNFLHSQKPLVSGSDKPQQGPKWNLCSTVGNFTSVAQTCSYNGPEGNTLRTSPVTDCCVSGTGSDLQWNPHFLDMWGEVIFFHTY